MKTAHTPGPWTAETSWNDHARVCVTAKLGSFVSNNTRGLVCDTTHTPFLEQEKANARLIAAAPDMHAFIMGIIDDQYDRVSPGVKHEARRILASINGGNL